MRIARSHKLLNLFIIVLVIFLAHCEVELDSDLQSDDTGSGVVDSGSGDDSSDDNSSDDEDADSNNQDTDDQDTDDADEIDYSQYIEDVYAFAAENSLSSAWSEWMITWKSTLFEAYTRGRTNRSARFEVTYEQDIVFNPPWASEAEHFARLEELAELTFTNWDFTFSENDPDAEFTVVLGHTGIASSADTTNDIIYLIWEGIFSHEFAHLLGIFHHDCDNNTDNTCPPDEGTCIMDRNSVTWGPTEQFLFNLSGERFDDDINDIIIDLNSRYPAGYGE